MSTLMVTTNEAEGQGTDHYFSMWYGHPALWKGNPGPAGFACNQQALEEPVGPQGSWRDKSGPDGSL